MTKDELILTHILGCTRSEYYLKRPQLNEQQKKQFQEYKDRCAQGEPLQYVLGSCEFVGLEFKVDSRVLIPRPETEVMVDLAMRKFFGNKLLEIGTGSGCIAITLAKHFPEADVTAIDVSKDALDLAQENASRHGITNIDFVHKNLNEFTSEKKFEFIISNPPYIPTGQMWKLPEEVKKEPVLALDGGDDGLDFYRAIIKMIPSLIRQRACLMMEFGDGQGLAVKTLIASSQLFSTIQIHKDLNGKDRIICAY